MKSVMCWNMCCCSQVPQLCVSCSDHSQWESDIQPSDIVSIKHLPHTLRPRCRADPHQVRNVKEKITLTLSRQRTRREYVCRDPIENRWSISSPQIIIWIYIHSLLLISWLWPFFFFYFFFQSPDPIRSLQPRCMYVTTHISWTQHCTVD